MNTALDWNPKDFREAMAAMQWFLEWFRFAWPVEACARPCALLLLEQDSLDESCCAIPLDLDEGADEDILLAALRQVIVQNGALAAFVCSQQRSRGKASSSPRWVVARLEHLDGSAAWRAQLDAKGDLTQFELTDVVDGASVSN